MKFPIPHEIRPFVLTQADSPNSKDYIRIGIWLVHPTKPYTSRLTQHRGSEHPIGLTACLIGLQHLPSGLLPVPLCPYHDTRKKQNRNML